MNAAELAHPVVRQALCAVFPLSAGAPDLRAELARVSADGCPGLSRSRSLHFVRVAMVPPDGHGAGLLLVDTSFEGTLAAHLDELWHLGAPAWTALFAGSAGPELDRAGFGELVERHQLRVTATCSAHAGFARALIENDERLDRLAQELLDQEQARGPFIGGAPGLVQRLRARAAAEPGLWLGSVRRREVEFLPVEGDGWPLAGRLAALTLQRLRSTTAVAESSGPEDEPASDEGAGGARTAWLGVVHGGSGLRRAALDVLLGALAERRSWAEAELARVHEARWVWLPDGRLVVSVLHDGTRSAFRGTAPASPLRAVLLELGAIELGARIWYSAYPELSVTDVLRNHRTRELLAAPPSPESAHALAALL